MESERGQTTVFFTLILTGLLLLTAVGIEIGRIVYARGEVGKAADAAALAAVAQVDVPYYRETGEIRFLPNVYAMAQDYASRNSTYLQSRNIGVAVTDIYADREKQVVFVTLSADLSSLMPGILPADGTYSITGYAEVRLMSSQQRSITFSNHHQIYPEALAALSPNYSLVSPPDELPTTNKSLLHEKV